MSFRTLVTYPRVVNVAVDFLTDALAGETVEARGDLPEDWVLIDDPVIVASTDVTPELFLQGPIAIAPTLRLVAWSNGPTKSHDLVMLAAGHMEAHNGELFTARLYTGPSEARDPDHGNAHLCAVTLRCRVRSTPVA